MSVSTWDAPVPFDLVTPLGTLNLNVQESFDAGTGYYLLDPAACRWEVPLRLTNTNLPQKSGTQLHKRYDEGAELVLAIQLWETLDDIACDELLTEMVDDLRRQLNQFKDPPVPPNDARVIWTPPGADSRMLKAAKLQEMIVQTVQPPAPTVVTARFKSPYPYAMDFPELTTSLNASLVNGGSADFWPVIRVFGVTTAFTITNTDMVDEDGNQLQIEFDANQIGASAVPGGGDYVEIDTFYETMYLNGDGANYKPGLVMSTSTFFPIQVGTNDITITGAAADVLWQNAWA